MNLISFCRRLCAALLLVALFSACSEEAKPLLQVGEKATPFSLEMLGGGARRLEDYAGKGLVITFMSSWCPCSNNSMPLLEQASVAHKSDQIAFLLVGIQDSRKKFDKFTKKWNVPFDAGYDKGDRIAKDYGVSAPPTTFFIDRNGIVKRAFYGDISVKPEEFRQWVKEVL
ncbi:MAG: TlpA family protein disulfide reductase [Betaproteobacteria bacterium]|nr:TlpA family protein disulfide reductase [Betaproteobacteria bacterium]